VQNPTRDPHGSEHAAASINNVYGEEHIVRKRKGLWAVAATLAGLISMLAFTASPASAAATSRRDACITGACGSATVTWGEDLYAPAYVKMSVADTDCDGHAAEIRFIADQSHLADPYKWYGPWHVNNNGCNGGFIHADGYFQHGDPLYGFWVEVCVKGTSRCKTSTEASFPN